MKKVYIDLGAYDGDTIRSTLAARPGFFDEVYGFEIMAHPQFWMADYDIPIMIYQKAAWVKDGTITMTLADYHPMSNTIMPGCHHYPRGVQREVKCIDFSAWLTSTFSAEDYIVIKMDIEGAEFDVLDKMIADGTLHMVNELAVEFHEFIMPDEYAGRREQIMAASPIPIQIWG